jgi:L-threonylcarbamoyladenylate synthase
VVRATQSEIDTAVETLRSGELVAFPTETVYGLGANAADPAGVAKIFALKGRPADHPVIVHLDHPRYLHRWVATMPPVAERLAAMFWPGPLTLILPKAPSVLEIVTGGQPTIGIRVPSHPMAQQLLTAFGGGIAAPSANRYGRLSPTRAEHVREEFGDAVRVVLDGGETSIGLESMPCACCGPASSPARSSRRSRDRSPSTAPCRAFPATASCIMRRRRRSRSSPRTISKHGPANGRNVNRRSACWPCGRRSTLNGT